VRQSRETGVRTCTSRTGSFARVRVGRIVEVRVGRLANLRDVEFLNAAVFAAVHRVGHGAVICSDHRAGTPLVGEVANVWSHAMRKANTAIARAALLLDPSNTMYNLQLERVVHCAGNEERRLFKGADELCEWLDGTLTEAEREALRTLFPDGQPLGVPESRQRASG
jgi:hypothetical protein